MIFKSKTYLVKNLTMGDTEMRFMMFMIPPEYRTNVPDDKKAADGKIVMEALEHPK